MENITILENALNYIEQNMNRDVKTEEIAKACYCSKSALEKIFRCINHISVHDYVVRRKMTCAGRVIFCQPDRNVLDIAMEYGYGSNEAFTRAFKQVWNRTPSDFRKSRNYAELFPKYLGEITIGEYAMSHRKNVDISELYDLFISRRGCFFVCCDVKKLVDFNAISRKAGDLTLIEALNRMNAAAGDEDVVFRIGADEFVMLTNSKDEQYAKERIELMNAHNEEPIKFENQMLPLALHTGITRLGEGILRYNEMYGQLHRAIMESKGL